MALVFFRVTTDVGSSGVCDKGSLRFIQALALAVLASNNLSASTVPQGIEDLRATMRAITDPRDEERIAGLLASGVDYAVERQAARATVARALSREEHGVGLQDLVRVWQMEGLLIQGAEPAKYCVPRVDHEWPEEFDRIEYGFVFGQGAELLVGPGERISLAPGQFVFHASPTRDSFRPARDPEQPLTFVETQAGARGYVSARHIWFGLELRSCASRVDGEWKLTSIVFGD